MRERPTSRRRTFWLLGLVAALVVAGSLSALASTGSVPDGGTGPFESLYTTSDTATLDPETASVNVGVRFTPAVDGYVIGVEFLRGAGSSRVSLYGPAGSRVGTSSALYGAQGAWASGWFKPVRVTAGEELTASVFVSAGRYYSRDGGFATGRTVGHLAAPADAGVYAYGTSPARPTQVYSHSEYFVSPVFVPDGGQVSVSTATPSAASSTTAASSGSSPSQSTSLSASPSPSATTQSSSASPSQSPSQAPSQGQTTTAAGVTLTPVDGGPGYYGTFSHSLPTDASFFPIGVWFESVGSQADINTDKAAGINTYVVLTGNSDLGLVASNGMNAILQADTFNNAAGAGAAANKGWLLADEADMNPGPPSAFSQLDSTRASLPADSRLRYANYSKGVLFWDSQSDAAQFVNKYQDLVSADLYWFSDNDACDVSQGGKLLGLGRSLTPGECHRASNYGRTVDRLRSLVSPSGSKPVWSFVEVGHPGTDSSVPSIAPDQVVAAVWSSIIHGARGIIYFNHSFGGPCQSQHVLRDSCYADVRAAVTTLDARIQRLAPVLNSPTATGLVTRTGAVDVMAKWYDGHYYLFAGSNSTGGATTATFTLNGVGSGTATVLDENRSIPISNGSFSDGFADPNTVHIYRID